MNKLFKNKRSVYITFSVILLVVIVIIQLVFDRKTNYTIEQPNTEMVKQQYGDIIVRRFEDDHNWIYHYNGQIFIVSKCKCE